MLSSSSSSSLLLRRGRTSSFPQATRRGGALATAPPPLRAAASSEGANEEDKPKVNSFDERRRLASELSFNPFPSQPRPRPQHSDPRPPRAPNPTIPNNKNKPKRRHLHSRPKPKPKPPTGGAVNRPVAYLPPHKLSLTPEERAATPPTPVQRGREEVAALCAVLPEGSEDKAECEDALQYYERLASGDGEACSLAAAEAAAGGGGVAATATASSSTSPWTSSASSRFADPTCADERERFESFVRELLYAGNVSAFVKALGRRKRGEEERRRGGGEAGAGGRGGGGATTDPSPSTSSSSAPSISAAELAAETERRRQALVALFRAYDRDGNGRLDAAEFREAAAAAGDPLTGSEVAKIFTALDIHGAGVSLDDFLAAVEAEDFMKPASPLAAWLRAHAGGGSIGELPGVDQLL